MTSNNKDKRMHRKTADRLLAKVIDRANEVNGDPTRCYCVTRMVVFGSYVNSDRDDLGDLDIAMEFKRKYTPDDPMMEKKRDEYKGNQWLERYAWPEIDVKRYLRCRSGYISIHELGVSAGEDEIIFSGPTMEIKLTDGQMEPRAER